jgi:hypothetical protein
MVIGEHELAVVLQASIEHAKELLETDGGFLPFGTRAGLDGAVEFLEVQGGSGGETIDALYRRLAGLLADQAGQCEILAAAMVANASLPGDPPLTVISVQVEASDFCRSITVPYRVESGAVRLGEMIPEEADPLVFAG